MKEAKTNVQFAPDGKIRVRSSSFSKIVAYLNKDEYPKGGVTYAQEVVEEEVYQYKNDLSHKKEIQKGILCSLRAKERED